MISIETHLCSVTRFAATTSNPWTWAICTANRDASDLRYIYVN
jgi:hypothetical protein